MLDKLVDLGVGKVADLVKGVVDRFWPPDLSADQKAALVQTLTQSMSERERTLLNAQKSILVAELTQGDTYTKRARPSVIYFGLLVIFLNHVLAPFVSMFTKGEPITIALPAEFWWAWTGICGTWIVGRTMEKRGAAAPNRMVAALLGMNKVQG